MRLTRENLRSSRCAFVVWRRGEDPPSFLALSFRWSEADVPSAAKRHRAARSSAWIPRLPDGRFCPSRRVDARRAWWRERHGLRYEGVIFDMDGTLIEPLLDFEAIRRDLGIPANIGILEAIERMPAALARDVSARLLARELEAVRQARLLPGARETIAAVNAAGMKTALLTRNAAEPMALVLERLAPESFDLTWSREDGPIKPEPDGVLRACAELGIAPERTACVGDFHYDITAANAAGAVSILLAPGPRPEFADEADHVIGRLDELLEVLGLR